MVPNVNSRGHSFKGVAVYLLHDRNADTSERVEWTSTHNLPSNDIEQSSRLMAWTDSNRDFIKRQNGGSHAGAKAEKGNVYHFSLSWAVDENPSREEMEKAAHEAMKHLSLDEHQYYLVAHNDTDHAHVHIVVNLVNPTTGLIHDNYRDYKSLDKWAHEYEKEHGIKCEKRDQKYQAWEQNKQAFTEKDRKVEYSQSVSAVYQMSDSAGSFQAALSEAGLTLAQGQRRGFTVVDDRGKVYALNRLLEIEGAVGKKEVNKAINERLKGLDRETLPRADDLEKARQSKPLHNEHDEISQSGQKEQQTGSEKPSQQPEKAAKIYDRDAAETQQQLDLHDIVDKHAEKLALSEDPASKDTTGSTVLRKQWVENLRQFGKEQTIKDDTRDTLRFREQWAQRVKDSHEAAKNNADNANIVADQADKKAKAYEQTQKQKATFEEYINRKRAEMQDHFLHEQIAIERRQAQAMSRLEEEQKRRTAEKRKSFEAEQNRLELNLKSTHMKKLVRDAAGDTAKDQESLRLVKLNLDSMKQRLNEERQALEAKHKAGMQRFTEDKELRSRVFEDSLKKQEQEHQQKIEAKHKESSLYREPVNDTQRQRGAPSIEQDNIKPIDKDFNKAADKPLHTEFKQEAAAQKQTSSPEIKPATKPNTKAFESGRQATVNERQTLNTKASDINNQNPSRITEDFQRPATQKSPNNERQAGALADNEAEAKAQKIAQQLRQRRERAKGLNRER